MDRELKKKLKEYPMGEYDARVSAIKIKEFENKAKREEVSVFINNILQIRRLKDLKQIKYLLKREQEVWENKLEKLNESQEQIWISLNNPK